jgi:hypothetical protein
MNCGQVDNFSKTTLPCRGGLNCAKNGVFMWGILWDIYVLLAVILVGSLVN